MLKRRESSDFACVPASAIGIYPASAQMP